MRDDRGAAASVSREAAEPGNCSSIRRVRHDRAVPGPLASGAVDRHELPLRLAIEFAGQLRDRGCVIVWAPAVAPAGPTRAERRAAYRVDAGVIAELLAADERTDQLAADIPF